MNKRNFAVLVVTFISLCNLLACKSNDKTVDHNGSLLHGTDIASKDALAYDGPVMVTGTALAKEGVFKEEGFELNLSSYRNQAVHISDLQLEDDKICILTEETEEVENSLIGRTILRKHLYSQDGQEVACYELEFPKEQSSEDGNEFYPGNARCDKNGRIYAAAGEYQGKTLNNAYIGVWEKDGTFSWELALDIPEDAHEYFYIVDVVPNEDGVYVVISGDETYAIHVSQEGNADPAVKISGANAGFYHDPDGNGYLLEYIGEKAEFHKVDMKTGQKEKEITVPKSLSANGIGNVFLLDEQNFLYDDKNGLFSYHLGDENPKIFIDYVNSDLSTTGINQILYINKSEFYAVYSEDYEPSICAHFIRINPEDVVEKEIIEIGGIGFIDQEVKEAIIDFNKSSDKYKITIRDYDQYNTEDDPNAGITKLNNDILAGDMPDILLTTEINTETYINKGLLTDIGELMAGDPEISKLDLIDNVNDAYKINGKLYEIIPDFSILTMVADKKLVGDRKGWNFAEMKEVLDFMGKDAKPFGTMERSYYLYFMMLYNSSSFIDRNTGKCNFVNNDFYECLNLAKNLPEEIDYNEDDHLYSNDENNKYLMEMAQVIDIGSLSRLHGIRFDGKEITCVGFPCEGRNGSAIVKSSGFAIPTKSENIDGAWQFLRTLYMDDFQEKLWHSLPVNRKVFMEKAEALRNKKEGETFSYAANEPVSPMLSLGGMTKEDLDEIMEMINNIHVCGEADEEILKIIEEESSAFFSGGRSVEETAGIIQSRVQLYLNEKG